MTYWGIGPKFALVPIIYGLLAGLITWLYPEIFVIEGISYAVLATAGGVFLFMGLAMLVLTVREFNKGFNEGKLVTTGFFSISRNPIYASWILFILPGMMLFTKSWPLLTVPLAAYAGFKFFVKKEVDFLTKKFGPEYLGYKSKVNELLPIPKISKQH